MADVRIVLPTLPQMDKKESETVQANGENVAEDLTTLAGRKKRYDELRLKMVEARKTCQTSSESRDISNQKWMEEYKKDIDKLLCINGGVDMTKCKKWEKGPFGWDVLNQRTLQNAYKKRANNVEKDKMKEAGLEFYRVA